MAAAKEAAIFSISADRSFADALAAGLLAEADGNPLALARMLVLLPNRRACRSLREAFLRAGNGRAMLLPRMSPLGDIEEDPLLLDGEVGLAGAADLAPAMDSMQRQMLLARLVGQAGHALGGGTPDQAFRLAGELAGLLDQMQTQAIPLDRLAGLVPEEFAKHWQLTLTFLDILSTAWPAILAEREALDPAERRNRLLAAQAEAWRRNPPDHPVIAAGSTGSIPATAALLGVVAGLPQGRLVLPGLDLATDEEGWAEILREETHPQYGMARLLQALGIARSAVRDWPLAERQAGTARPSGPARLVLSRELFRTADASAAWVDIAGRIDASALIGLSRITARTQAEEAVAIAILLREALEVPGRTAALVTPDRGLARRVAAELARWGLAIDDSAGRPLSSTPPGTFLRLVLEVVETGLHPVSLLALLKHPFTALGRDPSDARQHARALDKNLLRGVRPAPGIAGLRASLDALGRDRAARKRPAPSPGWAAFLDDLEAALSPLLALWDGAERSAPQLAEALIETAEALAARPDRTGAETLWAGEDGEALARFLDTFRAAGAELEGVPPRSFPALVEAALVGQSVRPAWGSHPRLSIWGPMEARLQRADLMILGGLNEGVWPGEAQPDAWLSRPMRRQIGLPLPERRIGQAAHDFAQAFAAPEVVLTRAEKIDGQPTEPSRFLVRLDVVLKAAGLVAAFEPLRQPLDWARLLRDTGGVRVDMPAPAPRPALAMRPRELSVSGIERLRRDPYAVFARDILKLYPLDDLDMQPGVADRGTAIHAALEDFLRDFPPPAPLPTHALDALERAGRRAFSALLDRPALAAFWWPRFRRIASWLVEEEGRRRAGLKASHVEADGRMPVPSARGFTLRAIADRIDILADGSAEILDYKTGRVPSLKEVKAGFSPQLPLEALIAAEGGFGEVGKTFVSALTYWKLSGGNPPGETLPVKAELEELLGQTRDGLERLVTAFDSEVIPYRCKPSPAFAPRYSDYDHLARLGEWRIDAGPGDAG